MTEADLVEMARDTTSHLNAEQAEMELRVYGALRGLRIGWVRKWLSDWEKAGGTIPDELRQADNDALMKMDPEKLFAVKYSAVRRNLG